MVHRSQPTHSGAYLSEREAEPSYGDAGSGLGEDMERKMLDAREQLDRLRHEQERVEQEERRLERLRLRQEEFLDGSRRTHDHLQRAVSKLEREVLDKERQLEGFRTTRETLARHLEAVRNLAPERWHDDSIEEELERSLVILDDARTDYERCGAHLGSLGANVLESGVSGTESASGSTNSAMQSLKTGFFLTLPLLLGLFGLALFLVLKLT